LETSQRWVTKCCTASELSDVELVNTRSTMDCPVEEEKRRGGAKGRQARWRVEGDKDSSLLIQISREIMEKPRSEGYIIYGVWVERPRTWSIWAMICSALNSST
jgi:hypothetical protein